MSRLSGRSTRVTSERSWKPCRQPDSSAHAQLSFDDDRLRGKHDVGGLQPFAVLGEAHWPNLQQAALAPPKKVGRRAEAARLRAHCGPGPARGVRTVEPQ
eukprot:9387326-Pyramimonas_sp.AAC.1